MENISSADCAGHLVAQAARERRGVIAPVFWSDGQRTRAQGGRHSSSMHNPSDTFSPTTEVQHLLDVVADQEGRYPAPMSLCRGTAGGACGGAAGVTAGGT